MHDSFLDRLFAQVYDRMLAESEARGLSASRRALLAGLSGRIVELGAGTGLNLPYYGGIGESLLLAEPSAEMVRRLRVRAATEGSMARIVRAEAEALPLANTSVDHIVVTLVLCTVRDPQATLAEIRRVLRPSGTLVLFEHVRARGARGVAQVLLDPVHRVLGRGCRLRRDTRALLDAAGFDTSEVRDVELPAAPRYLRAAIQGVAKPLAAAL